MILVHHIVHILIELVTVQKSGQTVMRCLVLFLIPRLIHLCTVIVYKIITYNAIALIIYALVGNLKVVLFTVYFNICCLEGHTVPSVISQLFNPLTIFTFINRHIAAIPVNSHHQVIVIYAPALSVIADDTIVHIADHKREHIFYKLIRHISVWQVIYDNSYSTIYNHGEVIYGVLTYSSNVKRKADKDNYRYSPICLPVHAR